MHQADNLDAIPGVEHGFCSINDPLRPDDVFICKQVHSASVIEWQAGQVANTVEADGVFTREQVHSASVIEWQAGQVANTVEADGVFTREQPPIAVITADCLPILMTTTDGAMVAAVHGGWKGLKGGIIANAVQQFAAQGFAVEQLQVAIGPSIKPCCYEVSAGFIAQFQADQTHVWHAAQAPWHVEQPAPLLAPQIAPPYARQAGSAWFDLSGYGVMLLQAAGVKREQIDVSEVCTYCSSPTFASYRRRTHHPQEAKTLIYSWIARSP